jgi:putative oxidoreductase
MVWVAGIIEVAFGLAVLVGFKTLCAAAVLALCVGVAFGAHQPMGDMMQSYKDPAIAGGFLYVFAFGAGMWSVEGPGK